MASPWPTSMKWIDKFASEAQATGNNSAIVNPIAITCESAFTAVSLYRLRVPK